MSDYVVPSSTLEDLPNELFLELFDYLDLRDLYRGFMRLNTRIDLILINLKHLRMELFAIEDLEQRALRFFLPRTTTLILYHSNSMDNFSSRFTSIRSLVLVRPTRQQWDSIRSNDFPHLECLHLNNYLFAYRTERLCSLIFSNAFVHLHTCSLPRVAYDDEHIWTGSPNLRSLEINTWDIRVYARILAACPALVRLRIELGGGNDQHNTSIFKSTSTCHPVLRQLALVPSGPITSDLIDSMLSLVPNLERFSLKADHRQPSHVPMDTLASILQHRVPRLTRININISLPNNLCCEERTKTNHPLFISHKIQPGWNRSASLIIIGSLYKLSTTKNK